MTDQLATVTNYESKLSNRTKNALRYWLFPDRCVEVEEHSRDYALMVAGFSRRELLRVPNLGLVSVGNIEQWLDTFGLILKYSNYLEETATRIEIRERAELARLKAKYEAQT